MTSFRSIAHLVFGSLVLLGFAGCGKSHDHGHDAHEHGGHVHTAPHGGVLVELGDHQFNLEMVRDPAAGTLSVYVLDAHAEDFVRIPLEGFVIHATVNGAKQMLPVAAVANPITGETIGNTAEFAGQAEWLKSASALEMEIPKVEIRGSTFAGVRFRLEPPAGK